MAFARSSWAPAYGLRFHWPSGSGCCQAWSSLPIALPPLAWHPHELLFGYAGAVIAGFLLTAVPNWTGGCRCVATRSWG